jgi:hypothetical protein
VVDDRLAVGLARLTGDDITVSAAGQVTLLPIVTAHLHAEQAGIEVTSPRIVRDSERNVVDPYNFEGAGLGSGGKGGRARGSRYDSNCEALYELAPRYFATLELVKQIDYDSFHCVSPLQAHLP